MKVLAKRRKQSAPAGKTAGRPDVPLFEGYSPKKKSYDEFFDDDGRPRREVASVVRRLNQLGRDEFRTRQKLAEAAFFNSGVTFAVYSDSRGAEKIFPFDLIPRIIAPADWAVVERGLKQRVAALNAFLNDVYGEQKILRETLVPRRMVEGAKGFLPAMRGVRPPHGVYVHIAGIDLLRDTDGRFVVLEDNVRTPSGVSYVIENRAAMKKVFPMIFSDARVRPVEEYPLRLREALASVAPTQGEPHAVVLTPGPFNSAYFEHSFLARRMGCELVEGSDLFVDNDKVYAKTTRGPQPVDVIYKRIDDAFLDPEVFRKDSVLGVPGLVGAYAKGNVALANALGNGVVDDKAIYYFVPQMIRFYQSEEPILGQVPTYICEYDQDRKYVLDHLEQLVVKAVDEAGGYGMLMGPQSTKKERAEFARRIRANPRKYIAQPRVEFSTCPTWTGKSVMPRRVDLRPYVVTGKSTWVLPSGLTRVALVAGSYVVNSSQGGGSKDTWVLEDSAS